jgi:hypothetical protein
MAKAAAETGKAEAAAEDLTSAGCGNNPLFVPPLER